MSVKASVAGGLLVAYLATYAYGELAVRRYWRDEILEMLARLKRTPANVATVEALKADVRNVDHELRIKHLFPVAPFVVFVEFDTTGAYCDYGARKLMLWYGGGARVLVNSV